jgi:GTP-dependent phosphoenolpyruvate carboxykinase
MEDSTPTQFHALMAIDRTAWVGEIQSHEELFAKLYDRLPKDLFSSDQSLMADEETDGRCRVRQSDITLIQLI